MSEHFLQLSHFPSHLLSFNCCLMIYAKNVTLSVPSASYTSSTILSCWICIFCNSTTCPVFERMPRRRNHKMSPLLAFQRNHNICLHSLASNQTFLVSLECNTEKCEQELSQALSYLFIRRSKTETKKTVAAIDCVAKMTTRPLILMQVDGFYCIKFRVSVCNLTTT